MALDYFTFRALASELSASWQGAMISHATWSPPVLLLGSDRGAALRVLTGREAALRMGSMDTDRAAASEGRDAGVPYLLQARVDDIELDARDRILRVRLERCTRAGRRSYGLLIVELMAPWALAALVRERNQQVLACWGRRAAGQPQLRVGTPYARVQGPARLLPGRDSRASFGAAVRAHDGDLERAGARVLAMMDRSTMREILYRSGVAAGTGTNEADDAALDAIWSTLERLYGSPPASACYTWMESGQWHYSLLEPTRLAVGTRNWQSVNDALMAIAEAPRESGAIQARVAAARRSLRAGEQLLRRRFRAMERDLAEAGRADELERKGLTLMARLDQVPAGAPEVELVDVFDIAAQRRLRIALDPDFPPAVVASRYLKRAGKLRRRRAILPPRLRHCAARISILCELQEELAQGAGLERAEQWMRNSMPKTGENRQRHAEDRAQQAHPRRYRTSRGWSVWAGRNNRENDTLTHRLAAQNDVWLHAHGYPGSHVILRREGRREEPDARTLEEAAGVAAYWSKGRTARRVPVVYTLAKYVSRRRGGAPGQAVLKREKSLMVTPALLPKEDDGD